MGERPNAIPESTDPDYVFENAVFHALAQPRSRLILQLLATEPRSIEDLVSFLDQDWEGVTRRMTELTRIGLVGDRVTSGRRLYLLGGSGWKFVEKWLSGIPTSAFDDVLGSEVHDRPDGQQ